MILDPQKPNMTVYHRIWRNRENGVNLCQKCEHPLMFSPNDKPKLRGKYTGSKHHMRYYHLEKCPVCGRICGDELYA